MTLDASGRTPRHRRAAAALAARWHLLLVSCAALAVLVRWVPVYPEAGLDPSWGMGVNRAVVQGLVFGRDIVFTYGPYGSILSGAFDPALRWLPILGGLVLAAGFVTSLWLLLQSAPRWLSVAAALTLVLGATTRDACLLMYPLLVFEALGRQVQRAGRSRRTDLALAVVLTVPLGLLPLIKFSAAPCAAVGALLTALVVARRGRRGLATAVVLVPLVAATVLWSAVGQPLTAIPDFVTTSLSVATGYSAMAVRPKTSLAVAFICVAGWLVALAALEREREIVHRAARATLIGLTLLVTLKGAFVREDMHRAIAVSVLLVVGALACTSATTPSRRWGAAAPALVLAPVAFLMAWGADAGHVVTHSIRQVVLDAPRAAAERVLHPERQDWTYRVALAQVRETSPLPPSGPDTDIYSYGQAALFASGAGWNPRPVFQSYTAYTPSLARLNAAHLQGPGRPRRVLFRVEPIDERLPALEDGTSWWPLLASYRLRSWDARLDYAEFARRSEASPVARGRSMTLDGRLDEPVRLPASPGPWLATIEVTATTWGRLEHAVFRPSALRIELTTATGQRHDYAFVPGMAMSEFLLSPAVLSTAELVGLASGGRLGAVPQRVSRIEITSTDGQHDWQSHYRIRLREAAVPGLP